MQAMLGLLVASLIYNKMKQKNRIIMSKPMGPRKPYKEYKEITSWSNCCPEFYGFANETGAYLGIPKQYGVHRSGTMSILYGENKNLVCR